MQTPPLNEQLRSLLEQVEAFEAPKSEAKTGPGSRLEGGEFEVLIQRMWRAFSDLCVDAGAVRTRERGARFRKKLVWHRHVVHKLVVADRELIIPHSEEQSPSSDSGNPRWLETEYAVQDLVESFPGTAAVVKDYAPDEGRFAGGQYPSMYAGMSTGFDDTVVLVDAGVLREKVLLEYKTAKSSKGGQIDGNAHERLSFQIMQYLEAATRYTKCSLVVLANGAFVRYKNKYHVNFHIQADRLSNFSWFSMEHACTSTEYVRFLTGLLVWLFEGTPRYPGRLR
jgi:hypothetical protein